LVLDAKPRFDGHRQPNVPLWGRYDDSQPATVARQVALARRYGVDVFVYGCFWSRGKRVFEAALDQGLLGCDEAKDFPFALMWANRMPRRILPVKRPVGPEITAERLVYSDPDDFLAFVQHLADRYFARPSYWRHGGAPYLSIFDTNFFLRDLGLDQAAIAIARAKRWLVAQGLGGLHLAAIDPIPAFRPALKELGFDSVCHYVFLPEWKGPAEQDFSACAQARAAEWPVYRSETGLPYYPSVSPGWDATPRAADYGKERPRRYPWSPVVTGSEPVAFERFVRAAAQDVCAAEPEPVLFVASWNEWSEGHYLEPDQRVGEGYIAALAAGARP
jgi:hypothetical protein